MITKRSKFWTIVFAFLPGAGHMYNGFLKLGVSFMGLFFAVWTIASAINIGAIAFLTPVIWFYAFFDCVNRICQDDEEFYTQEDHYLFTREQLEKWNISVFKEKNLLIGVVLVLIGIYALWNNVVLYLISSYNILPPQVYEALVNLGNLVPQLVVAVLIIWAGAALITGKKKEIVETADPLKEEDDALTEATSEAEMGDAKEAVTEDGDKR